MRLFEWIRYLDERRFSFGMRFLIVIVPLMFGVAGAYHAYRWFESTSLAHSAVRAALCVFCAGGVVGAHYARRAFRSGQTPVARIQGFAGIFALVLCAEVLFCLLAWELGRAG